MLRYPAGLSRRGIFICLCLVKILVCSALVFMDQVKKIRGFIIKIKISEVLVKVFNTPNLYWETYSGEVDHHQPVFSGPLYGLVRTCIHVIPFSLMMFPTIYIYYMIIKETSKHTDIQIVKKRCNFLSAR